MPVAAGGRCRAAILISGSGTNLQAFIDGIAAGTLALDLALVISNRADAYGLTRAAAAAIDALVIPHRDFKTRAAFDRQLGGELESAGIDLVVLAGFMRILGPGFVRRFAGRILNIHPALLPAYPGVDTHARVLAAGDSHHGSTVHFVTEELDGGPRILAGRIPVRPRETGASLKSRVQSVEHRIYPEAAQWFADGRLEYREGSAWLDGQYLAEPVVRDFDL
jgi:phosphoribosylglycinamide formyltransferase-1